LPNIEVLEVIDKLITVNLNYLEYTDLSSIDLLIVPTSSMVIKFHLSIIEGNKFTKDNHYNCLNHIDLLNLSIIMGILN